MTLKIIINLESGSMTYGVTLKSFNSSIFIDVERSSSTLYSSKKQEGILEFYTLRYWAVLNRLI